MEEMEKNYLKKPSYKMFYPMEKPIQATQEILNL